jgi:hypothetical protein
LVALDVGLARRGRFVIEPGMSRGASHAVLFFKPQVCEFENEFLEGTGPRLQARSDFAVLPPTQRDENRIHRRLGAAGGAADGYVKRFRAKEPLENAELDTIK